MKLKWLQALASMTLVCLAGCSTQLTSTHAFGEVPIKYASTVGVNGDRLILHCAGATATPVTCQLWQEGGRYSAAAKTAVEFIPLTVKQQYLKNLIGNSAKEASESPQTPREFAVAGKDVALLQALVTDQASCLADKRYADLMLVCPIPPQGGDTVVMFIRGLCDRCRFQPAVLRKSN